MRSKRIMVSSRNDKAGMFRTLDGDRLSAYEQRTWRLPDNHLAAIRCVVGETGRFVDLSRGSRKTKQGVFTDGETIVLTTNHALGSKWWTALSRRATLSCFVKGRIKFIASDGYKSSPTFGSIFLYFGEHPERFAQAFRQFGEIMRRILPEDAA